MNTETNAENMQDSQHGGKPMLPAVRPATAASGLAALKSGQEIEIPNKFFGDFLRYVEQAEANIEIKCSVNRDNVGYTIMKHGR